MPKKSDLIEKLCRKPIPKNFTTSDLDSLMVACGCEKHHGGRGSSLRYVHSSGRVLIFDGPRPGDELYNYQVKKVIFFLTELGEIGNK